MSKIVLDCSVALKWAVDEPQTDRALQLREDFRNGVHELLAPDIFPVEVGHVFSKMHRQRKITEDEAQAYLAEVMLTPPELHPYALLMPRAYELSLQFHKSLYDCLYVALAEQENCKVVTADKGMVLNPRSRRVLLLSTLNFDDLDAT
jgi:predicted nucleic acid-binding protein